ncbi:uncharacterized protein LOC129928266 [Biomphalaria glabrata]|uniref:Uncharacterized protein LOC129928266 n=1 Tax=Biomphalaria glabrata TaxID=6526 RepID=A0A9W3BEH2_BIOGL|nr:uncharacterized protein LOC129928266 [Biomphalaria glabrata]
MSVLVITLIVFISAVSANPTGQLCDIYTKNVTEIVTKCLVNDSSNLLQALSNKESQIDVICNQLEKVSDLIYCIQEDIIDCLSYGEEMRSILPDKKRMLHGLKFICQHKEEIVDNDCMASTQLAHTQCLVSKLYILKQVQGEPNSNNIQPAICSMIKAQEECYDLFHGSCSRQLVDLAKEAYRKLFQVERCDPNHYISTENSNEAMKHLLRSILLPGRTYGRKYQKDELLFTLNTTPSRTEPNSEIKATEEAY